MSAGRTLLVLDLDETLVFTSEEPLTIPADFRVGPFLVHNRPHVESFLRSCAGLYDLAIWSSGSRLYVESVVAGLLPAEVRLAFVWSRERCTARFDPEMREQYLIKDLRKVKRLGYPLERILIVDDTPLKAERNYGNAIYVRPFEREPDEELLLLARYLASIPTIGNLRTLEKRNWRREATEKAPPQGPA